MSAADENKYIAEGDFDIVSAPASTGRDLGLFEKVAFLTGWFKQGGISDDAFLERLEALLAVPVAARELDVEAERREDESDALSDLRQAVKDGVSDEWLLAFIRQYPLAAPVSTEQAGDAWQVVPKIPTDAMCAAAREKTKIGSNYADHVYRAMLLAAPSPNNSPVGADKEPK